MKKLLLYFFLLILAWSPVIAQNRSIELYDLVRALLPDSLSQQPVIRWTDPLIQQAPVTWQSVNPVLKDGNHFLKGTVSVSIKGSTFSCETDDSKPCPFVIFLEGNENGYTKISISHLATTNIKPEQSISYLFSQPVKSKLYRKVKETGPLSVSAYEFRMAGRKTAWMLYAAMNSETGNGLFLKVFLSEKDIKEESSKME